MTAKESGDKLENAIATLVEEIHAYDCVGWSSAIQGVTTEEARNAAAILIDEWMLNIDDLTVKRLILSMRKDAE